MAQETERDRRFDIHGEQYIPETLMNAVIKFEKAYRCYRDDPKLNVEFTELLDKYAGRPSRLYYAKHMTKDLGGVKIYLKRKGLNHTGAHKINNAFGQALLAKYVGKKRLIVKAGAGQHGVAAATVAALLGMKCVVYMGGEDTVRQAFNVYHMRLLGVETVAVKTGIRALKGAVSETMREWTARTEDTHHYIGSCMGSYPFPAMACDFQAIISEEIKEEMQRKEGRLPGAAIAYVDGDNNATGSFYHFIDNKSMRLIGCEAAGRGIYTMGTAATVNVGPLGIFREMKLYLCQDKYGQTAPVYSISAGLDCPGAGPEHAYLHDLHHAEYAPVTGDEAVDAFEYFARTEGIIPVIESAYAVAYTRKFAPTMDRDRVIVIVLSRRGDKDVAVIARYRGENLRE